MATAFHQTYGLRINMERIFKLTGIELELNQTDRFSVLIGSMYVAGDLLSSLMCTIQNSVENAF